MCGPRPDRDSSSCALAPRRNSGRASEPHSTADEQAPRIDCPLRPFYASALLDAEGSSKAVAVRLGHASPAFTLQVYAHLMP